MTKVGIEIFLLILAIIAISISFYVKMLLWGVIVVIILLVIYALIRYFKAETKSKDP